MSTVVENLDTKHYIIIKGAKQHNLKNIDVAIPRNKLVVVTGVSGSGKSSLTIDTLYAEGQRRYVESLSSYARQFLMRMNKPEVDYIKGISPAIAVEQKVITRSSRSTVGTLTEIYDYLRLLYARVGKTFSPISGHEVKKDEVADVVDFIFSQAEGTKIQIFIPFKQTSKEGVKEALSLWLQKGFTRIQVDGQLKKIDGLDLKKINWKKSKVLILIDRFGVRHQNEDALSRCADSVHTAFYESNGDCLVDIIDDKCYPFSNRFELDDMLFEEPNAHFFNFNSPFGACKKCEGFGHVIGIDPNLVIPDPSLSVYDNAVAPWRSEKMSAWKNELIHSAHKCNFPIHTPIAELSEQNKQLLWDGNTYFGGINEFFRNVEAQTHKIQYRVMLSKYRGRTLCPDCKGARLRKDAQYVKIDNYSIADLILMPIGELKEIVQNLKLTPFQQEVAKRIFTEINNRLQVMCNVGLRYLTLNRLSSTLSGGETQRINLTRSLGSNLTNSMYILDEPSIGLHPRDTQRLIKVLKQLRDLGNTVVVVEHEEGIIEAADFIIDIGPLAGLGGGELVFAGPATKINLAERSLTADYLLGKKTVSIDKPKRNLHDFITVENATQHNLKNITAKFPLNAITVVTGVSGSGKTTLVKDILFPALKREIDQVGSAPGKHKRLSGSIQKISRLELIDQNPLGRSSRSNPVTYIKAYDAIRDLFASQQLAKIRGFKPKHFSFNVEGGRCETCKGDGEILVEMQFLADVRLVCEDCEGKRFKKEVIEVQYKNKSIFDVLNMSVDEAVLFFEDKPDVAAKIKPLQDVGLGYVKLGQSSSTLSGGEAQRVKLASYLGKGRSNSPVLFIFDEPSTGLHFNDINKLLKSFNALVEIGHTIIIVEHNMDIVKCADWIIDLGPEGGKDGGYLLYQGEPEGLMEVPNSYTAHFLKEQWYKFETTN